MYKKTITYTDYNGSERTEDFYFNLTEAELAEMQMSVNGGFAKMIEDVTKAKDVRSLINILKDIIIKSYGIKSDDGRKFMKKPEYVDDFVANPAFSSLYMELATNEKAAAEFINGIIPANLLAKAEKMKAENPTVSNIPPKT